MAMSGDCEWTEVMTAQVSASNPYFARTYPISLMVWRTMSGISTYPFVVISPATMASPVVRSVSQATRLMGSCAKSASRTASEI